MARHPCILLTSWLRVAMMAFFYNLEVLLRLWIAGLEQTWRLMFAMTNMLGCLSSFFGSPL